MLHLLLLLSLFNSVTASLLVVPKGNVQDIQLNSLVNVFNLETLSTFSFPDGSSFSIYKSDDQSLTVNSDFISLFHVEKDRVVSLSEYNQFVFKSPDDVPWHLSRVTKRKLPLDNTFSLNNCLNDTNIRTYVVDTGIDVDHPEFSGRAHWGNNFADSQNTDCNSHGTHVAGLIGSNSYGVCNNAELYAVKVLDCNGRGSLSGVIRGIEWVYKQHRNEQKGSVKSIINMSLGGGYSRAINMAVEKTLEKDNNFYVVVAAGNEDSDACDTSPASVQQALTVMASDDNDNRAWFSNWGPCADIYSPGVDILSTVPNGLTAVYSGTSMASPIAAGALNYLLARYRDKNMKEIKEVMAKLATKNMIQDTKHTDDTVNLLLYVPKLD
jgi:subtilisin family serine protease